MVILFKNCVCMTESTFTDKTIFYLLIIIKKKNNKIIKKTFLLIIKTIYVEFQLLTEEKLIFNKNCFSDDN